MRNKCALLFTFSLFLLIAMIGPKNSYAQNQQEFETRIGRIDPGEPGVFKTPFKCGYTYWGWTYPGHSAYSVDFNRGNGYDDYGDPVLASAPGEVSYILASHGQVGIDHAGGYETIYVHMKNITVRKGDRVALGQKIGEVGDVGSPGASHLHVNHARNGVRIKVSYDNNPYSASVPVSTDYRYGAKLKGWCP